MNQSHLWLDDILLDLARYADLHTLPEVSVALDAARASLRRPGPPCTRSGGAASGDTWFQGTLDELARYGHKTGLVQTRDHLLRAGEIYDIERRARRRGATVVPFPR